MQAREIGLGERDDESERLNLSAVGVSGEHEADVALCGDADRSRLADNERRLAQVIETRRVRAERGIAERS